MTNCSSPPKNNNCHVSQVKRDTFHLFPFSLFLSSIVRTEGTPSRFTFHFRTTKKNYLRLPLTVAGSRLASPLQHEEHVVRGAVAVGVDANVPRYAFGMDKKRGKRDCNCTTIVVPNLAQQSILVNNCCKDVRATGRKRKMGMYRSRGSCLLVPPLFFPLCPPRILGHGGGWQEGGKNNRLAGGGIRIFAPGGGGRGRTLCSTRGEGGGGTEPKKLL